MRVITGLVDSVKALQDTIGDFKKKVNGKTDNGQNKTDSSSDKSDDDIQNAGTLRKD